VPSQPAAVCGGGPVDSRPPEADTPLILAFIFRCIAVFPILADVVEVKTGSRSTAHWSNNFIRLNGWLRNCFAQLITPLDIDCIGQNWEESNTSGAACGLSEGVLQGGDTDPAWPLCHAPISSRDRMHVVWHAGWARAPPRWRLPSRPPGRGPPAALGEAGSPSLRRSRRPLRWVGKPPRADGVQAATTARELADLAPSSQPHGNKGCFHVPALPIC